LWHVVCGQVDPDPPPSEHFGFPEADVDETKIQLFGASVDDRALTRGDWDRVYSETDRRIGDHLAAGQSVIDASRYFHKRERLQAGDICREHGAELLTIFVDTPEHVTRERLLANRQTRARQDVSDDDFAAILTAWEPPTDDETPLILRFGEDATTWIYRHSHMLSDR